MKKSKKPVKSKAIPAPPAGPPAAPEAPADRNKAGCPIVAFGASAGGLDAFTSVLEELPADTGLALVLIQHLDPQHASILTELLSRATSMKVTQVTGGTRVQPNRVYVIPPNRDLIIVDGVLKLEPRPPVIPHMPIDRFFRSLAEDQASKAIAVVLSGSASDGCQGVRAIKAAGGITFAQDPGTAQYDGMPRSAIATGCIDAILPPAGIANELVRLLHHPYLQEEIQPEPETEGESDDRSLRDIFGLLRNATGVDFSLYKPGTIQRRTLRRMALLRMETLARYAAYIRQHNDELTALFQDILINVTSFFRESATFDAIKTRVLPGLFKDRSPADPVRVWVPGCATGEEVYSIAICLFEYMREANLECQVQIFGTDLSDSALEQARAGVYPETIAADVSQSRLRRFFVRVNSSYQIARSVRDACIFARQNVTKDPPFSKCDLIICRNVLIYLGPALQNTVMRLFHYALQPQGFLVLGLSEGVGNAANLFDPVDKKLKIYSRRPGTPHLGTDLGAYQDPRRMELRRESGGAHAASALNMHHRVNQMLLARYSPAALVVDQSLRILEFRGHTAAFLEHSAGEATLELARMVPASLGIEVRRLIRKAQGKTSPVKGTVSVSLRDAIHNLDLTVVPVHGDNITSAQFLVIIEESAGAAAAGRKNVRKEPSANTAPALRAQELEQELATMREYLQTVIEEQEASTEELKSAHEEVQSGNEELQSTNEELLTAKEELQSTNEELTTVNEEMQGRNAELQHINNDLLNLLSSVNIPILMLGGDLRIRRFTPHAEKLFSLLATDIGRPVSDLRLKINVPNVVDLCHEVLDDLSPREREVQDVEGRMYSMWIRPYRTAENHIEGVVIALFDITERKQAAEARYRRLFEAATDGIVIADAGTGVILDLNPFIQRLSGYGRSGVLGEKFWESPLFRGTPMDERVLLQLHDAESMQKAVTITTSSGQRVETEVICNIYAEGEKKVVQFNIRDISERRRNEAEVRQQAEQDQESQRLEAVGRLAGGVAHDFNNLLTALLGSCDLLEQQLQDGKVDNGHIDQIRAAAEKAGVITRQLLAFTPNQVKKTGPLDLNEVIGGMQRMLHVMLPEDVHLKVKLSEGPAMLNGSRMDLEQVVLNLALRARDSMPQGGEVSIETGSLSVGKTSDYPGSALPAGDYVTLVVKDSGAGLDPETQSRLFGPFSVPDGQGSHLGLASTYLMVQQFGGHITVQSTVGAGATFTVYLPRVAGEGEPAGKANVPVKGGEETVLLVDDDSAIRRVAGRYLKKMGYEVLEAPNGAEALRIAREHAGPIGLLLADVVMPNMSGREVAFQLESGRPDMKVIYMSGHNRDVIAHHGVLTEGRLFLQKPFRLRELAAKVRAALDDGNKRPSG